MFDAMFIFIGHCRKNNVSPDTSLAMITSTFFAMSSNADPEWKRNVSVAAVNQALETMEELRKEHATEDPPEGSRT